MDRDVGSAHSAGLREKYKYNRLILGMPRVAAAIKAGYSINTAKKQIGRISRRAGIDIVQAINVSGMDDIAYANRLVEKTRAVKLQNCRLLIRRDANGDAKVEQNADDFIEVEDNATQMRALELIGDFKKLDYTQRYNIDKDGRSGGGGPTIFQVNIHLANESKDIRSLSDAAPIDGVHITA